MGIQVLHDSHSLTIGAPLLLILVFCFSFFLVHPANSGQAQPVASNTNNHQDSGNSGIKKIPAAKTKLSAIPPAQTVDSSSGLSTSEDNGSTNATNTPQSSGRPSTTPSTPQNAPQNHNGAPVSGVTSLFNGITSPLINALP